MSSLKPDLCLKIKEWSLRIVDTNIADLNDSVLLTNAALEAYIYIYIGCFNSATCTDSIVLDANAVCFLSVRTTS